MASATPKATEPTVIDIPPIEIRAYRLRLVGISPLIMHAWSQKVLRDIADKQGGRARDKKAPKDPQADYEGAFYRLPNGNPGFPTLAFKSAAVSAARQVEGITMTFLRGTFHTVGDLVEVEGTPHMRMDTVRVGMGTADLRYRPEFTEWAVSLVIRLNVRSLTLEQLVHLFKQAGFSVGVGDWRPEKNGRYGMFDVVAVDEVPE